MDERFLFARNPVLPFASVVLLCFSLSSSSTEGKIVYQLQKLRPVVTWISISKNSPAEDAKGLWTKIENNCFKNVRIPEWLKGIEDLRSLCVYFSEDPFGRGKKDCIDPLGGKAEEYLQSGKPNLEDHATYLLSGIIYQNGIVHTLIKLHETQRSSRQYKIQYESGSVHTNFSEGMAEENTQKESEDEVEGEFLLSVFRPWTEDTENQMKFIHMESKQKTGRKVELLKPQRKMGGLERSGSVSYLFRELWKHSYKFACIVTQGKLPGKPDNIANLKTLDQVLEDLPQDANYSAWYQVNALYLIFQKDHTLTPGYYNIFGENEYVLTYLKEDRNIVNCETFYRNGFHHIITEDKGHDDTHDFIYFFWNKISSAIHRWRERAHTSEEMPKMKYKWKKGAIRE